MTSLPSPFAPFGCGTRSPYVSFSTLSSCRYRALTLEPLVASTQSSPPRFRLRRSDRAPVPESFTDHSPRSYSSSYPSSVLDQTVAVNSLGVPVTGPQKGGLVHTA